MKMKLFKTIGSSILACSALGFNANAIAAVTVINENFNAILVTSPDNYEQIGYGSVQTLGAFDATDVDLIKVPFYGAISGNSVDLNGSTQGSLVTSFSTILGNIYTLTFDYGTNSVDNTTFNVKFGTNGPVSLISGIFGGSNSSYTATFFGTGNTETLSFTSTFSGASGSVVDNVLVTSAIPEPGEWAMMIAGLGVVGLMVRRRRAN